jgi:hypothetical protein
VNTSVVKAAATLAPETTQALDAFLNTLFAVWNALGDGNGALDVGPNVTAVVKGMRLEEVVARTSLVAPLQQVKKNLGVLRSDAVNKLGMKSLGSEINTSGGDSHNKGQKKDSKQSLHDNTCR